MVDVFGQYLNSGAGTKSGPGSAYVPGYHSFSERSGGSAGSQFGLKGAEDLGGGLQAKFMLEGLVVDESRMRKNLDLTQGLIVAEAVMMGLAPHLGRQQAHDLVYEACREALGQGHSLLDILKSNQAVAAALPEKRLRELCDPANYLGTAPRMTDDVVRSFRGA